MFSSSIYTRIKGLLGYVFQIPILSICMLFIVINYLKLLFPEVFPQLNVTLIIIALLLVLAVFISSARVVFIPISVALLLVSYANYRVDTIEESVLDEFHSNLKEGEVEVTAFVKAEPKLGHSSTIYLFQLIEVKNEELDPNIAKSILFRLKKGNFPQLRVGQVCNIRTEFSVPENFSDFDYSGFLRNQYIYLTADNYPEVQCKSIESDREGGYVKNALLDRKRDFISFLQREFPEPEASLLIGVLLGDQRLFDKEFFDKVRITGTSHIIAASGYNVSVIVMAVNLLFGSFLSLRTRIAIALVLIWAFALISGLSPSITRATIMHTIALAALVLGYPSFVFIALPLAIVFYGLVDPRVFLRISFVLSVLSTSSLIYIMPTLEKFLEDIGLVPNFLKSFVQNNFLPTLSCTVGVAPYLLFVFKEFSLIGLISNLILLPILEGTMLLGFLYILLNSVTVISTVLKGAVFFQLKFFSIVVEVLGEWDWGVIRFSEFSWVAMVSLYVVMFFIVISLYPEEGNSYLNYNKKIDNV